MNSEDNNACVITDRWAMCISPGIRKKSSTIRGWGDGGQEENLVSGGGLTFDF